MSHLLGVTSTKSPMGRVFSLPLILAWRGQRAVLLLQASVLLDLVAPWICFLPGLSFTGSGWILMVCSLMAVELSPHCVQRYRKPEHLKPTGMEEAWPISRGYVPFPCRGHQISLRTKLRKASDLSPRLPSSPNLHPSPSLRTLISSLRSKIKQNKTKQPLLSLDYSEAW